MFRRNNRGGIGLLLLLSQLYSFGFSRIPPVTLSFIAGNVAIYLRLLQNLPRVGQACVSAHHVWFNGDWKRLVLASFFHLDDWHLYYNMVSFLWKGKSLESSMGSPMFLFVLSVFSVMTSAVLVALDMALANVLDDPSYLYTCAAGFSGVIFALKVVTTYELPHGTSMVMGMFPVPMRYACWAELVLIQLLVPNASFTGHLAGIIVGLLYVKGPLKAIINKIAGIAFRIGGHRRSRRSGRSGPSYTYHASSTGTQYSAQQPTRPQHDSDDEELQAAIRASLHETHHAPLQHDTNPGQHHGGDNDPAVQAAIAESISRRDQLRAAETRHQRDYIPETPPYPPGGASNKESMATNSFSTPPSYAEATNEGLYPSIPNAGYSATPSAPPPYDTPVTLPYPEHDFMPTPDVIRQRRLQRFQK